MEYYFDATRLIAKIDSPTPSGIDRVDVHYAKWLLQFGKNVHYVAIVKGVFCLVNKSYATKLVNYLYDKWILNIESSIQKIEIKPSQGKDRLFGSGKFKTAPRVIDIDLFNQLLKNHGGGYYINTSHYGVGKVEAYYLFKTLASLKIIFFLHDLIPIDYPEYVNEGDKEQHEIRVQAMINFSDIIIVNSEYTKDRLFKYCDSHGLKYPRYLVNQIGVEDKFFEKVSSLQAYPLIDGEYFVYVGTIEARKNHILLLNLWREIVDRNYGNGKKIPKLVLIGKMGWKNDSVLDMLNRCESIQRYVYHLEGLKDDELINIVKNSKAFLFPSFVEGWGMPLVEALALKVPVLCSDIPVFHEAGQDLLTYLSPIDAEKWNKEIWSVLMNDKYRQELIKRQESYSFPTWKEHFEKNEHELVRVSTENSNKISDSSVKEFKNYILEVSRKKAKPCTLPANNALKRQRLIRKFKNNPKQYLLDSKHKFLRYIGKLL